MEAQSLILGVIIVVLTLLVVVWPFINLSREQKDVSKTQRDTELVLLNSQREAIYATIRELDFDFETGKITQDDHAAERAIWVERGVNTLKAIDSLQQQNGDRVSVVESASPANASEADLDAQIEAAIASRRRTV